MKLGTKTSIVVTAFFGLLGAAFIHHVPIRRVMPLPPLANGPDKDCLATESYAFVKAAAFCRKHSGTSECWAEIVHAGVLCHKALGCPYAKTDEEARSPIVSECEAPCVDIMHALDAHYGVSR